MTPLEIAVRSNYLRRHEQIKNKIKTKRHSILETNEFQFQSNIDLLLAIFSCMQIENVKYQQMSIELNMTGKKVFKSVKNNRT